MIRFLLLSVMLVGAGFLLIDAPAKTGAAFSVGAMLLTVSLIGIIVCITSLIRQRFN